MTTTQLRSTSIGRVPENGRRRRLVLGIAAGLVLVLVAVWLVVFSPVFGVRSVQVDGVTSSGGAADATTLTKAQIVAAANVGHGTPLVRLDTAAITQRVERLPDVESAQVETSFPSTVIITIVRRTAVGYVKTATGVVLVDRTGVHYHQSSSAPSGVPQLVLPTGSQSPAASAAVATVAVALPATLRSRVASIQAMDASSVSLVLTGGIVVRWGTAERNGDKARIVEALRSKKVGQIDVTDPDQPFTRHS